MIKKIMTALMSTAVLASGMATEVSAEEKLKVVTSIHPVNEIVKTIGGDKVETTMIIKPGTEPHDFELTPQDMITLKEAKVVFINGLGMEPWLEKVEDIKTADLSKDVEAIEIGHDEHEEESKDEHKDEHKEESNSSSKAEEHKDEHGHEHGSHDPHIWLGVKELMVMADNAEKSLSELDPKNSEYYKANAAKFKDELKKLEDEFKPQFEAMTTKSFVTGHEAFAYLCKNAGLEQKSVVGVFGEGEATPQKMKELVEYVKEKGIKVIFVEKGQAKEISETIAAETESKTVEIGTLETEGEIIPTIREIYTKIIESGK